MSFFLRKAFSFGPLRLNLSKGGLGLSAGVTGARVGIGPRGAYVAGGRHGMYYREYVSTSGKKVKKNLSGLEISQNGKATVKTFVDTGLTYNKAIDLSKRKALIEPAEPTTSIAFLALSILFLIAFFVGFSLITLILFFGFLGLHFFLNKNVKNAKNMFEQLLKNLEKKEDVSNILNEIKTKNLYFHPKYWYEFNVFKVINLLFYENPDYISIKELSDLESQLSLFSQNKKDIKTHVFSIFLNEISQDHIISNEEEQHLIKLQQALNLQDDDIALEKQMIIALTRLRDTIAADLVAIQSSLKLKSGEVCYLESEGRLLKEKKLRQYQRDSVIYHEIGYDVDMDGKIFLTNQRIFILSDGSRTYALNRILDITLSLEDNTVQLNIENRKNPLIFTMPDIQPFAGMLHKLT